MVFTSDVRVSVLVNDDAVQPSAQLSVFDLQRFARKSSSTEQLNEFLGMEAILAIRYMVL